MNQPEEKFNLAEAIVTKTGRSLFLSGGAGTGKTTFLRKIREGSSKCCIVVAPTGVAAVNAGGVTIHSFFQLPLLPFYPVSAAGGSPEIDWQKNFLSKIRFGRERHVLLQKLELLIIDEVSMVRCDVLDAMDKILRDARRKPSLPFGGVQLLMIGDLYQLPPVVKEEDRKILGRYYQGPYFFQSAAFNELHPLYIGFDTVFRQTDKRFIDILNRIRENTSNAEDIDLINRNIITQRPLNAEAGVITLTSHNRIADKINQTALDRLPGNETIFCATITGEFPSSSYPGPEKIVLKEGAQVMFIKNDTDKARRYYNGKIGTVRRIEGELVYVEVESAGDLIEVKKWSWKNIRYVFNRETQRPEEEEVGCFTQLPLKLAWSVTIHKSQGLSFDKLLIDAGQSFAPGQVYVALSRCRSLSGIRLLSPIKRASLYTDRQVTEFMHRQSESEVTVNRLSALIQQDEFSLLKSCFEFESVLADWKKLEEESVLPTGFSLPGSTYNSGQELDRYFYHGQAFIRELETGLSDTKGPVKENVHIQSRIRKAGAWFLEQADKLLSMLELVNEGQEVQPGAMRQVIRLYKDLSKQRRIFESLQNGFNADYIRDIRRSNLPIEKKGSNGFVRKFIPEHVANPLLYLSLLEKREELSREYSCPPHLVCGNLALEQMAMFLPGSKEALFRIDGLGGSKVRQYGQAFLDIILAYCQRFGLEAGLLIPEQKEMTGAVPRKKRKGVLLKTDTRDETLKLIQLGMRIDEIAGVRQLQQSTIENHICKLVELGKLDHAGFINKEEQEKIDKLMSENPRLLSISDIKERLPDCSYFGIRIMRAVRMRNESFPRVNDQSHPAT